MLRIVLSALVLTLVGCASTQKSDDPCVLKAEKLDAENREQAETLAEVYGKSVEEMHDAFDATLKKMVADCEAKAEKSADKETE